jgi:hypothetical protein
MKTARLIALMLWLIPVTGRTDLYCDGDPPELHNKDAQAHTYQIQCASKTEKGEIQASQEKKLKGKSGCKLTVGNSPPVKLFTEMICEIRGGKLSCELI